MNIVALLILSHLSFSASADPVKCTDIKAGQKIEIAQDNDDTLARKDYSYELDNVKHFFGPNEVTAQDLIMPNAHLKKHIFTQQTVGVVQKDGYVYEDRRPENLGNIVVSCNVIAVVDGHKILIRQMHYGEALVVMQIKAMIMTKVRIPKPSNTEPAVVADEFPKQFASAAQK